MLEFSFDEELRVARYAEFSYEFIIVKTRKDGSIISSKPTGIVFSSPDLKYILEDIMLALAKPALTAVQVTRKKK